MMNRLIFVITLIINFTFIQNTFSQENNKKAVQILDKMSNLYKSMVSFS